MEKDILLALAGLVVGGMNAIAGGGMLIGFPVLLAAGLPAIIANATGNIVVLPGQIASAFGYRSYLRKTPKQYAWLLVPWTVGAALGALLLRHTSGSTFERFVPGLIAFAVVLFAFQPLLHSYLHKHMKSRSKRVKPLLFIGIALLPVAVYGGFFGAGVGFIMLAFLGFTKIHDAHQMNAMKNVAAAFSCAVCVAMLSTGSYINWRAGLSMAIGSTIGGYYGSRVAVRMSTHVIRVIVIIIGVATTIYLGVRTY